MNNQRSFRENTRRARRSAASEQTAIAAAAVAILCLRLWWLFWRWVAVVDLDAELVRVDDACDQDAPHELVADVDKTSGDLAEIIAPHELDLVAAH